MLPCAASAPSHRLTAQSPGPPCGSPDPHTQGAHELLQQCLIPTASSPRTASLRANKQQEGLLHADTLQKLAQAPLPPLIQRQQQQPAALRVPQLTRRHARYTLLGGQPGMAAPLQTAQARGPTATAEGAGVAAGMVQAGAAYRTNSCMPGQQGELQRPHLRRLRRGAAFGMDHRAGVCTEGTVVRARGPTGTALPACAPSLQA